MADMMSQDAMRRSRDKLFPQMQCYKGACGQVDRVFAERLEGLEFDSSASRVLTHQVNFVFHMYTASVNPAAMGVRCTDPKVGSIVASCRSGKFQGVNGKLVADYLHI